MRGGPVVKVKREVMEACMRCPLCDKLLKEATTISLCLHTFCRKCIYEKLSDEEVDSCPVCNIDLGCLPMEKLRPDHNLQDIRSKIFPLRRRKVTAPEVTPAVALPAKRKERSLSSLVVSAPKVPVQAGSTGRRSKFGGRKSAATRSSYTADESNGKDESEEAKPMGSSSPESPSQDGNSKRKVFGQDSSETKPCSTQGPEEVADNKVEMTEAKAADLWTPLNCLVEAANRTKSSKSHLQGLSIAKSELTDSVDCNVYSAPNKSKPESSNGHDSSNHVPRAKTKLHGQENKVNGEKNNLSSLPSAVKRRRLTAAKKRGNMSEEQTSSEKFMLDATRSKSYRRNSPIWFSLVPSEDQKRDTMLPQIPSCYLRIKDGKMTVSLIQKYLVQKLGLPGEVEVEIKCRGQPILPSLQLHKVVDLWFRTASTARKVPMSVGSSAKDFVMELQYCRKFRAAI